MVGGARCRRTVAQANTFPFSPEDFTRQRQLSFPVVMLFILQKTVKSIQRHLHEFLDELTDTNHPYRGCSIIVITLYSEGAIC